MSLHLTKDLYDALRTHGEETYPHECCGILLGKVLSEGSLRVEELMRAGNTRLDSAHNRYNIAPAELIAAQRAGRAKGLDIIGFYHSHPDHPAMWSSTDFAEAHWFGCAYVITAVAQGKSALTNAFLLTGTGEDAKAFVLQEIVVG